MPDADTELPRHLGEVLSTPQSIDLMGRDDAGYAYGAELADMVRLAEIAHVSSAFGSLIYDLLVLRPELAAAVGAFAVGVVSCLVTDSGIGHPGALQVITRYLHEVHVCSSHGVAHSEWLLERIQVHAHVLSESVGVG